MGQMPQSQKYGTPIWLMDCDPQVSSGLPPNQPIYQSQKDLLSMPSDQSNHDPAVTLVTSKHNYRESRFTFNGDWGVGENGTKEKHRVYPAPMYQHEPAKAKHNVPNSKYLSNTLGQQKTSETPLTPNQKKRFIHSSSKA